MSNLVAPSRPRRGLLAAATAALTAVSVLAGCSSSTDGARAARSGATDVPFTGCDKVACSGEIGGAKYQIRLPAKWNGSLLLYSHGYRNAQPAPPDFAPVQTDAQVAASDPVATALLAKGYALAGSAYRTNGWAVLDGVAAGEGLHDFFVAKVGKPDRIYVWGDSLGGLITELLAEKHPDWINGAAPMCGVLGGADLNFDLALDAAFAIKTLIDPALKIVGYRSNDEAVAAFKEAAGAVVAATRDVRPGVSKLALIAALLGAPTQSSQYDGSTARSKVGAIVEALATAMVFGTVGRYEVEQRVGGNPSGNAGADYASRVSATERALVEAVAPGSTDRYLALLAAAPRVSPDPAARARFAALGTPTGDLRVPTITLHTADDPLVLVQNETVFRQKVYRSANRTADLVQLYTAPPPTYPAPAPYGAGHCNFTTAEQTDLVSLLDGWVRGGVFPGADVVAAAFAGDPGLAAGFAPGNWPAGAGA